MAVEALALAQGATAVKAAFELSKKVYDLVRSPDVDPKTIQEYLMELQGLPGRQGRTVHLP